MEEKQEKKQPELKGKMPIVWLTGILVIILGCVTVYTFKLVNENKKSKQVPQAQQPQVIEHEQKTEEAAKEEKKETTSNTTKMEQQNNNDTKKVVKVTKMEGKSNEKGYTLVFSGLDKNNNVIWKYETKIGARTELTTIEELKVTDDRVYLNEAGTITVLNKETGKVIWQNKEYNGASSSFCFDDKETLYICGYYGPDLFIVDKNGKTIKTLSFGDKYMWPGNLKLVDNNKLEVNVTLANSISGENASLDSAKEIKLVVNLNDFSIKETN